ncbi:MAG: hypothetical protein PHI12_06120 [Dehalococcoidales bacterium]|nr:hypothetical protein [Dehalococcoidales bacterium]
MFHSFVCDDPETYEFGERAWTKTIVNTKLEFICSPEYFHRNAIPAVDFDKFPITVYPTSKETSEEPLTVEQERRLRETGMCWGQIAPEFSRVVNYKKAFRLFRALRSKKTSLFNQICLYVFSASIAEFRELYRNDHGTIAFLMAILEALAGAPPVCKSVAKCDECGRKIPHGTSIENHLLNKYGASFMHLRKIRHKFFHQGDYFNIADVLFDIYDRRRIGGKSLEAGLRTEEKIISDLTDEIELLQKVVRRSLLEAFLAEYDLTH